MDLKTWRESRGLTRTDAAPVLGVTQPSLSRIERGEQWPDPETIEKIIRNSGGLVTAEDLVGSFMEMRRAKNEAAE